MNDCAVATPKPPTNAALVTSLYDTLSNLHFHAIDVSKWETPRFKKWELPHRSRPITTAREETEFQVEHWRRYLIESAQGLGGVEFSGGEAFQVAARRMFNILTTAGPTECVDALMIYAFAHVVASWDACERGDVDNAWRNLVAADHAEGQIQGIMIVARNQTLCGALHQKKRSAKSKEIYRRLLARAREVKAQKPKFSRLQIATFLSKYKPDGTRRLTGGEFDLKASTIERGLRGLDIADK